MRRSLYASGSLHVGLLAWVAFGGLLFDRSPDTEFEVTGVTLMSVSEFEALTGATPTSEPAVDPAPASLAQPALPEAVAAPTAEAPPPARAAPAEPPAPHPSKRLSRSSLCQIPS